MAQKTLTRPIRLILGQAHGGQMTEAKITFICEGHGGFAHLVTMDNHEVDRKMRFIDEGESEVVWEEVEKPKLFGKGVKTSYEITQIRVRRDFQFPKG